MSEINKTKKSKTELIKELQDVVSLFNEKKELVDMLLNEIDELESKYHSIAKSIKNNNK